VPGRYSIIPITQNAVIHFGWSDIFKFLGNIALDLEFSFTLMSVKNKR